MPAAVQTQSIRTGILTDIVAAIATEAAAHYTADLRSVKQPEGYDFNSTYVYNVVLCRAFCEL